ncbi:protein of unknown function [Enterobacter cancerogenus]|nr:protein of unknown function [Enterobacter cancerogenus]
MLFSQWRLSLLQMVFSSGVTARWQFIAIAPPLNNNVSKNSKLKQRCFIFVQLSFKRAAIVAKERLYCNINHSP